MQDATKSNLSDRNIWARGLYMLFYAIAYAVAETVLTLVVLFQFVCALVTGSVNRPAQTFGANISAYVYQILQYVSFNSEEHAFPFADWPDEEAGQTPWDEREEISTENVAPAVEPATAEPVVEEAEAVVEEAEAADSSTDESTQSDDSDPSHKPQN